METILIAIIWVAYGAFAAYQTEFDDEGDKVLVWCAYIAIAPAVFVGKALYGAFKTYE